MEKIRGIQKEYGVTNFPTVVVVKNGNKHEGNVMVIAKDATEEVTIGDRVIYKEYGGTEVKIDDEDLILLTADDLVAKYEDMDKIPE